LRGRPTVWFGRCFRHCFATPLQWFTRWRRPRRAAIAKPEIDILLEFLELISEPARLELHLFDLAVNLPHLIFEPVDPDGELRPVLQVPGTSISRLPGVADVARWPAVSLGNKNLAPRGRDLSVQSIEPSHGIAPILGANGKGGH